MAKKIISPDAEKARTLLDELWHEVQAEEELPTSPELDELVNSGVVAVRYSLPTQLLGKLTDPNLDCLCFQKLAVSPRSSWNPRTFSSKVVVPWVLANQNVLGTSTDPYVGNPLRIPRLEENTLPVKNRTDWKRLFEVLQKVEEENDPARTRLVLTSVLRSIKKKLAESVFEYAIPERVSLRQVREIVERFLSEASGGDRGLATAAALFETFGKHFGIYAEVRRFAINASDTSTGSTADNRVCG